MKKHKLEKIEELAHTVFKRTAGKVVFIANFSYGRFNIEILDIQSSKNEEKPA